MKEQEYNMMPEEQANENPIEGTKEATDANQTPQELNEELENIAELFRTELAKAQEDAEKDDSDSEQTAEEAEAEAVAEEIELCACCGEEPKPENGEYCEKCIENMRRYPLGFSNILIAVLITVMACVSVVTFFQDVEGYAYSYEAKKNKADGFLVSALENYDEGIAFFKKKGVFPKNLYLESAEVVSDTMTDGTSSMNDVAQRVADGLSNSNPNLFIYKKSVALRDKNMVLYGTMKAFYDVMNNAQYSSDAQAVSYDSVMAQVEALIGTELSVKAIDNKTEKVFIADEGMLRFCQYMYAYTSGKTDDATKYLKLVHELKSDCVWLYAYELGVMDIKSGNLEEAKALAEAIYENNKEESDSYCLNSAILRVSGDFENAVKMADKGLKYCPGDAEILRNKAMAYVAMGDIEKANEAINEALSNNQYGLLYFTAIVIENEQGNKETVAEMKKLLEDNGIGLSESLNSYLGGKITAKQLFSEGAGDVE